MRATSRLVLLTAFAACGYLFQRPLIPGDIRGKLTAQQAGAGAVVPAVGARVLLAGTTRAALADENGDFLFKDMPPGEYIIRARYDRDGDGKIDNDLQVPGARIERRVVRSETLKGAWDIGTRQLNAAGFLVGVVKRNGAFARGAAVVVPGLPPARVNPDDGTYRLALYGGDWDTAVVYNPGDTPRFQTKVAIQVRGETKLDFDLTDADPSEGALQGRIVLGGEEKHAGATVRLIGAAGQVEQTQTNDDGTFAIAAVPAGLYRMEAEANGFTTGSFGAFAVGGAPLPTLTLLPQLEGRPDCDGDGTPDRSATEGDPGDLDDDNDGVPDTEEAPACICDPEGAADANINGICDVKDIPALSSRSLVFPIVQPVPNALVGTATVYNFTPEGAVTPVSWQCATLSGPAARIQTSPDQILVTPQVMGALVVRCTATDAEGAEGSADLALRATRFTAASKDSFVLDGADLQAAIDSAAQDTQFTEHDLHVAGSHTAAATFQLKGAATRLWGGWNADFSDRNPAQFPTRVTLSAPAFAVFQSASGWQAVLDGFVITAPSVTAGSVAGVVVNPGFGQPATVSNNIIDVGSAGTGGDAFALVCTTPCHVLGNVLLGGAGGFAGAAGIGANAVVAHNLLFCGGGDLCAGIRAEAFQAASAWAWANIFWLAGNIADHRHGFVQRQAPYTLALFANAFIDSGTNLEPTFYWEDAVQQIGDHDLAALNARTAIQPDPANIEGTSCVAGLDRAGATTGFTLPAASACVNGFTYPTDPNHPINDVFSAVEPYLRFDRDMTPRRTLSQGGAVEVGPDELP